MAQCPLPNTLLRTNEINTAAGPSSQYSQLLSRGGLSIPSSKIKHYVCNGFVILELVEHILLNKCFYISERKETRLVLLHFGSTIVFSCPDYLDSTASLESEILVNVYFDSKQKLVNVTVRKHQKTSTIKTTLVTDYSKSVTFLLCYNEIVPIGTKTLTPIFTVFVFCVA